MCEIALHVFPEAQDAYEYRMKQSQSFNITINEVRLVLAYLGNLLLSEGTDGGAMSLLRKLHLQFIRRQLFLFLLRTYVSPGYRVYGAAKQPSPRQNIENVRQPALC